MDVAVLVKLLAPCLPGLMALGKKVGEASVTAGAVEAAKKIGAQSAEAAEKIWRRLWPKVNAKEAAKEAAEDVAADPADEDALGALRKQLQKILASDAALAAEVDALLKTAQDDPHGTWIQVQGDGNQVIGSMSGNAKAVGSVTGNVTL